MIRHRYTNLVCIKHPHYFGDDYVSHNCYNCATIFTQVLRAKRAWAVAVKQMEAGK